MEEPRRHIESGTASGLAAWGLRMRYQRTRIPANHRFARLPRMGSGAGVALLLVVIVIAVLASVVVDMSFTSRVQLKLAMNGRDQLKARYLASSAMNLARILLWQEYLLNKGIQNLARQFPQAQQMIGGAQIRFTNFVRPDSELLRELMNTCAETEDESLSGPISNRDELTGELDDTVDGIGEFEGNFFPEISDESGKINLGMLRSPFQQRIVIEQLRHMLLPQQYNFLFETPAPDGYAGTREDLIANLVDWVDADTNRFSLLYPGSSGGPEDAVYAGLRENYRPKNAPFDTLEEIHLVRGVSDDFMRIFGNKLTVYPGNLNRTVNLQTADWTVIMATLCGLLYDPTRARERSLLGCGDPIIQKQFWDRFEQWRKELRARVQGSGGMGGMFGNLGLQTLLGAPVTWAELDQYLKELQITLPAVGLRPEEVFGAQPTVFRVKAVGEVNKARATIDFVVATESPQGAALNGGQIWGYHEH
ncbi:MAG: hypothetical protein GMKNLPBB_00611 [Myxococcota bacterium]|nr:hypothetical protein [Myxococcota bacterium]